MKLAIFALLGCCVLVHSASLSADPQTFQRSESGARVESLENDSSSEVSNVRRWKRSGGGGSGGFLAGIGSAILGKVAEASSGASSGSSDSSSKGHQYESVEYGPPVHNYDEKNFDIWSFKKAILNTLFQALKAIGGGVIALKGKLIKGGGIVISTKGSIISAKGEAISTLGRHIAASAVLSPPKTSNSYVYEAPPVHGPSGHDSYGGPPPSAYAHAGGYANAGATDSYGHSAYAAPSDDADHPGLLIIKPAQEAGHHQSYKNYGDVSSTGLDISPRKPDLSSILADSFGGNQKDSGLGDLVKKITGGSSSKGADDVDHKESPGPVEDVHHHPDHSGPDSHSLDQLKNHNMNFEAPFENVHFSLDGKDHRNFGSVGNTDISFTKSVEIPLLQNPSQPAFYLPPTSNHLQDYGIPHNSYGALKRRSRSGFPFGVRIIPGPGFRLTDPRLYRI